MATCWLCVAVLFTVHHNHHHVHCQHSGNSETFQTDFPPTSLPIPEFEITESTKPEKCALSGITAFDSLEGDCLRDLFTKYGTEDGVITRKGFELLLGNLGLGSDGDGHGDDHEDDTDDEHENSASNEQIHILARDMDDLNDDDNADTYRVHKRDTFSNDDVNVRDNRKRIDSILQNNEALTKRAKSTKRRNYVNSDKNKNVPQVRTERELSISGQSDTENSKTYDDSFHSDEESNHGDEHDQDGDECISADGYLDRYSKTSNTQDVGLDQTAFLQLCPVLIQQLDKQSCQHEDHDHDDHETTKSTKSVLDIPPAVWGYSFLSMTIISGVSLTGILIVPVFTRYPAVYKQLIAFLVALAVGTLAGDAVLHLIPHSYGLHAHAESDGDHDDHGSHDDSKAQQAIWRGLMVLFGIYMFFMMERLMHIYADRRRRKKAYKLDILAKIENRESTIGERLNDYSDPQRKSRYLESLPMVVTVEPTEQGLIEKNKVHVVANGATPASSVHHHDDLEHSVSQHSNGDITHSNHGNDEDHDHHHHHHHHHYHHHDMCDDNHHLDNHHHGSDHEDHQNHGNDRQDSDHNTHGSEQPDQPESDQGPHGHHHHNDDDHLHHHHHHHGSDVGEGIASVAWMVIMGDGLHNFTDGLAVGAAFADNLTGGISTSIAIFCHELPHELGDFAILLSSGMSVRLAVMYSLLSSLLSYIGMFIGITLSNYTEASLWIFALAGGMFLYIALVDMLPEMMHGGRSNGKVWRTLLLQNIGIFTGVGIMLVIGLFEDQLIMAFQ
ncbi:metal cation symporter ZIP14-like [Glandiceps talaboti]